MNEKLNPQTGDNFQAKSAPKKSRKKIYGALGGVALAGALAFGGGAILGNSPQATAQIAQNTLGASPSPSPSSTSTQSSAASSSTPGANSSSTGTSNSTTPGSTTPGSSNSRATGNKGNTGTGKPTAGAGLRGGGSKGFGQGESRGGESSGLSGTISAVSGNTITLKRGNVVVIQATVNDNTVYTAGGTTIKLSDLKVGETANIRTTTAADGTISIAAVQVVLNEAGGTISAIDATSLTLTKPDNSTVKVTIGAGATIQDLGKTINFPDLKTGLRLEVAGMLNTDGTLTAQVINVQHDNLSGTVTAINGNTLTIQVGSKGQEGMEGRGQGNNGGKIPSTGSTSTPSTGGSNTSAPLTKTIIVSSGTVFLAGSQSIQLSDVAVGNRVEALGALSSDGNSLTALEVTVQLPHYQGQVTSVNGSTIVIQDRGTSRTIDVTSTTKYLNGQASASLADVKTGLTISVEGTVDSSGKMTALVVQAGQGGSEGPKGQRQEQGQED